MTLVESVDLATGFFMPPFSLPDAEGKIHSSENLFGKKGLLVVFTCNHCPYADAQWPRLVALARFGRAHGIGVAAINANIHPDYPEDSPGKMAVKIDELGIDFPYLVDETQDVARLFKAQCTPDPYLFDADGRLVYHGRIDDNWKDEDRVTREELKVAMELLSEGAPAPVTQHPAMGCSIKWR